MLNSNILFIVTGSISVYKSLDLISKFKKEDYQIKIVMTKSAQKFVTPLTFSAVSAGAVYTDLFDSKDPMSHIELARWADKIIVAPATANFINKIAGGIADDLASNIYLAHSFDKPFIIYPAMNTMMLNHPQTQKSIMNLKSFGIMIGETDSGILACGEVGEGKLLHTDEIYKQLTQTKKNIKVLITSGGTREPIDGVRHIGNMSSGATGKMIAEKLIQDGIDVTFFFGQQSLTPANCRLVSFSSFNSLSSQLQAELQNTSYDYIIHLAAISDFSVDHLKDETGEIVNTDEKISSAQNYSIHLKKNFKIVSKLKDFSTNKNIRIIAFKLTHTSNSEKREMAVNKVFENSDVDFVVHNELSEIKADSHKFTLYSKLNKSVELETKADLGIALNELIADIPRVSEVRL